MAVVPSQGYIYLDPASFSYEQPQPLLTLEALLVLARRLPKDQVHSSYAQDVKAGSPLEGVADRHKGDLSLDEATSRIAEKKSHVFPQNLETDPEFNQLIPSVLGEIEPITGKQDPSMYGRCGWVFLSSPGAETPYHRDLSSRRIEYVYRNNMLLRRMGLKPSGEGVSPGIDQVKFLAMRSILGLRGERT